MSELAGSGMKLRFLLSCGHVVKFGGMGGYPHIGEYISCFYCKRGDDGAIVKKRLKPGEHEWSWFCPTCKRREGFESGEGECRRSAVRHWRKYPDHRVEIQNAKKVESTLTPPEVPLPEGEAPF